MTPQEEADEMVLNMHLYLSLGGAIPHDKKLASRLALFMANNILAAKPADAKHWQRVQAILKEKAK